MASGGYPGTYEKGFEITGIDQADAMDGVKVFHAGTSAANGQSSGAEKLLTAGGRVLGVTALGDTIADAQKRAYQAAQKIHWQDCYYRKDIAAKAIKS